MAGRVGRRQRHRADLSRRPGSDRYWGHPRARRFAQRGGTGRFSVLSRLPVYPHPGLFQFCHRCARDRSHRAPRPPTARTRIARGHAWQHSEIEHVVGRIEFRGVSFAFDAHNPLFDDVSLALAPGETVALAGASGEGKTTLFKLLLRFYDPQTGSIYIDGHDIRSVAWQEPLLLNDTLRSNLQLARSDATDEQIIDACVAAHGWEFVQVLPQRRDTVIHAGGAEFSTGQLQRMSLAQAFLRDAPIVLLDDPSSGLDSRSEMAITDALGRLRKHRTTLIIAHRYSTIRSADHVLFFNGDGTLTISKHHEPWVSHAAYRHAVEWQTALQPDDARPSN